MDKKSGFIIFFILVVIFISPLYLSAKTIKIGTDRWPPHEDIFNEDAPGFCTEVVRNVFRNMDIDIKITQYPWSRAVDLVFKGKNDALFCALPTEERAKYCYYPSEPITTLKYLLFVKKENLKKNRFLTYDDLMGKRIGIVRAFAYPKEFMDFLNKHKNFEEVESDDLNFKKLMAGRIDYTISDHANGVLLIKQMKLHGKIVPIFSKIIHESSLNIIFSKKTTTPEFVEKFSFYLKEFKKTDRYRELNEKYYSTEDCCPVK